MVIKSIRVFSLLLAGMAIMAHMIIPHDHHLSGQEASLKESCPLSQEKSDHHPFFPLHCHAFNDLASERFSPVIVKQVTQTSFASVIWRTDCITPALYLSKKVIENSGKPFPDISIPDFSPLRAPPNTF